MRAADNSKTDLLHRQSLNMLSVMSFRKYLGSGNIVSISTRDAPALVSGLLLSRRKSIIFALYDK